jgi:hypothetical protein
MEMTELLAQAGALRSMAHELGVSETQARSGAEALVPAILGGFKKQVQAQPSGLEGLGGMLGELGGGRLLDNVLAPKPTDVTRGDDVLGRIFGSKDVSRTVAQDASERTGIDPQTLKKMLPMLAMMVAGYMAKQPGAAAPPPEPSAMGGLGALIGRLTGAAQGSTPQSGSALSGIAGWLDLDGNGNPLDDVMRVVGKVVH